MFFVERCMGMYKKGVRNSTHLDESIGKGYVVNKAMTLFSRYVYNVETIFIRPNCNWDLPFPNHQLGVFNTKVCQLGAASSKLLWYILNNCTDELKEYFECVLIVISCFYNNVVTILIN